MVKKTRTKRVMTQAQRDALARGRATRDANRAARSADTVSTDASPEHGVLPANERVSQSAVNDSLTSSGEHSSASSEPRRKVHLDASMLDFAFKPSKPEVSSSSAASPGESDTGATEPSDEPGLASGISGLFRQAMQLGRRSPDDEHKKSRRIVTAERLEDETDMAQEDYQPLVNGIFILIMGQVVGRELAPDAEMAESITGPLVRIALRHIDPLRKLSPDGADLLASAGAAALYIQAIWPLYIQQRRERLLSRGREKAIAINAIARNQAATERATAELNAQLEQARRQQQAAADSEAAHPSDTRASSGLSENQDSPGVGSFYGYVTSRTTANGATDPAAILEEIAGHPL